MGGKGGWEVGSVGAAAKGFDVLPSGFDCFHEPLDLSRRPRLQDLPWYVNAGSVRYASEWKVCA